MGFANRYIDKNKGIYFFEAPKEIEPTPIWVIIPCYNEPDLEQTIQSVFNCRQPKSPIGILVVVNDSDLETDEIYLQNEKTFAELSLLAKESPYWISLHSIYASKLPSKNAGVGWARKIGMDWAITHFNSTGLNDGILVSLDADSLVSSNYFCIIEAYYHEHTNTIAATHYFEHVISEDVDSMAIVWYELYVRFYKNMLDSIGFPHSIYTVGSCFSVKAKAYVAQGGMNRKKAGEDFYFLHKLMPLGLVGNINNLTVYPSSRISDRVPFGTGPALQKHILGQTDLTACYPISSFEIIKDFIANLDSFFFKKNNLQLNDLSVNKMFIDFCTKIGLFSEIKMLSANCSNIEVFRKRFFHIFNAFKVIKWLNYAEEHGYTKKTLLIQSQMLYQQLNSNHNKTPNDPKLMLKLFREWDKARGNV